MLLALLHDFFKQVKAVHLNHGLRGADADRDENWCRNFCQRFQISYSSSDLDVPKNRLKGESSEVAARRLRLQYWTVLLANQPHAVLALGHHLDDKIENFFIRLFRASNTSGLVGLKPYTILNGIKIARPLLCLEKTEITHYLRERKIHDYCLDKSNSDRKIFRNKIRLDLMPEINKISGVKQGISKSLDFIEQDAMMLERNVQESIGRLHDGRLSTDMLLSIQPALWSRFLREWINKKEGSNPPLRGSILKNLQNNISNPVSKSKRFDINDEYFLLIDSSDVSLERKHSSTISNEIKWEWKRNSKLMLANNHIKLSASIVQCPDHLNRYSDTDSEYWNPQSIGDHLTIRTRRPADRMIPFGVEYPVRVKKLVSNAKLTATQKNRLVVITNSDGEIIWIPFVRRANLGHVSQMEGGCVKLTVQVIN